MSLLTLLIILAIYTVLILLFVPLEKIGAWQIKVKAQYKKIVDKFKD